MTALTLQARLYERLGREIAWIEHNHPGATVLVRLQALPDRESIKDTWFDSASTDDLAAEVARYWKQTDKVFIRWHAPWKEVGNEA
jgi:hypothetical protein